jgi:hypothetical protein
MKGQMKVIGIGGPRTLELRLRTCELRVWRAVVGLANDEERQRVSAAPETPSTLLEPSRLRQQAAEPHRDDHPVVVTGLTSVLAPLVRSAARQALDDYFADASAFIRDAEAVSPDRLRASLDSASAWTATLLALHRVQGQPAVSEAA